MKECKKHDWKMITYFLISPDNFIETPHESKQLYQCTKCKELMVM